MTHANTAVEDADPAAEPEPSRELLSLRAQIDAIDADLVELLARRSNAVMSAIPAKRGEPAAAAERRRRAVVARARALATERETLFGTGFDDLIEDLFKLLTARSIAIQHEVGGLRYDHNQRAMDVQQPDR